MERAASGAFGSGATILHLPGRRRSHDRQSERAIEWPRRGRRSRHWGSRCLVSRGVRESLKRGLDRVGLLQPTFRFVEILRSRLNARGHGGQHPGGLAPDGLPVPTPRLAALVGHTTVEAFLERGRDISESIRQVLAQHGATPDGFRRILDFGCGCGRVLRNWSGLGSTEVHGSDYNPELIRWCERNLAFGRFRLNGLRPPLGYPDEHFDFIYAFSVFTHLPEELQVAWMDELRRVLRVGGYLLITTHGESYAHELTDAERAAFMSGQLVVRYGRVAGTNLCAAFHPPPYVRGTLARSLDVIDYAPNRVGQDFILLEKRDG